MAQLQSTSITGSLIVTQGITGSFSGSATNAISASYAATASYALNAGDSVWTGSAGNIYYSGGNVGIGTASPTQKLDVNGYILSDRYYPRNSNNVYLYGDTGGLVVQGSGYFYVPTSGGSYFENIVRFRGGIYNDSSTYLTVNGGTSGVTYFSGNVGVGTTAPLFNLQVGANAGAIATTTIRLQNSYLDTNGYYGFNIDAVDNGASGHDLRFLGRSSPTGTFLELVRIKNTGNVGIGITNPNMMLSVNNLAGMTNDGQISWGVGTGFMNWDTGYVSIYGQSGTALVLGSNGAERMRITSGGSLLIGDTTQAYNPQTQGYLFGVKSNTTQAFISIAKSGQTLDSSGMIVGLDASTGYVWMRESTNLTFGNNNTERMRITSGGNIGIGTNSPAYKLDVNGNTNITGNLYFNSNTALQAARKYVSTAILSNAGYTVIGTVTGDALASSIRISIQGTDNSVVINVMADILVNHYQDILITSYAGIYTTLTLRVISNNNEIYSIEATTNSANACTTYVEIFPLNSETVVFGGSAQTGTSLTHPCVPGMNISATGGSSGNLAVGGDVGIGTTSPTSPLHVYNNADIWHTRIGGASGELRIGGQTPSGAVIQTYTPGGSVRQLYLQRDGGNVGIGNDNPTATLQINGAGGDSTPTLRLISAASDTFNWASDTRHANLTAGESSIHLIGKANSQYNQAYFGYRHVADGSTSNMLTLGLYASDYLVNILGNGNVGIGTTSPTEKLDVVGIGKFSGTNVNVRAIDGTIITKIQSQTVGGTQGAVGTESNNDLSILTNNTTRMLVTAAGNVGIGTTSPPDQLSVGKSTGTSISITSNFAAGTSGSPLNTDLNFRGYADNKMAMIRSWDESASTGNGYLTFWTNNPGVSFAERMRITSGGNVGIGISPYQSKLHVLKSESGSNPAPVLRIGNQGVGYTSRIILTDETTNDANISYLGAIQSLGFGLGSSLNQMVLTSTGNLGIGTSSPYEALDINGNIRLGNYPTAGTRYIGYGNNTFANQFIAGMSIESTTLGGNYSQKLNFVTHYYGVSAAIRMTISEIGNVGIGTTTPTSKLHVWNGGIKTTGFPSMGNPFTFLESNYSDASVTVKFQNINPTNNLEADLGIQLMNTGGSMADVLRIKGATGNVGIGTTSPASKLHVVGNQYITGNITVGASGNYSNVNFVRADGAGVGGIGWRDDGIFYVGGHLGFGPNAGNSVRVYGFGANLSLGNNTAGDVLTVTNGGNVGIGTTSPGRKFVVTGAANDEWIATFTNTGTTPYGVYIDTSANASTTYSFATYTNTGTGFFIRNNGLVGIGTTTPANKLEVDGGSSAVALRVSTTNIGSGVASLILANSSKSAFNDGVKISHGGGYTNITDLNGTNIMTWDMTNTRVGIGTISPGYTLDIQAASATIQLKSTTGTNPALYKAANGSNSSFFGPEGSAAGNVFVGSLAYATLLGNFDAQSLQFGTNAAIKMTITSGGNVGIGTVSPSEILHMKSSAPVIRQEKTGILNWYSGNVTGNNYTIYPDSATNSVFNITSAGNVGIGTTSPGAELAINSSNSNTRIFLQNAASTKLEIGYGPTGYGFTHPTGEFIAHSDNLYFGQISGASTNVTFTAAGNVGIGTTSPAYTLDVQSNITAEPFVQARFLNTNGSYQFGGILVNGINQAHIRFLTGTTTWNGAGAKQWQIRAGYGANVDSLSIYSWTAGTDVFYINSSGNVGIGTTSPSYKLDVNGVTRFQDVVRFKTNAWNLSDDGFSRFYFANSGRTYFGSGGGYEWRSDGDAGISALTNGGELVVGAVNPYTTGGTAKLSVSGDIISLGPSNGDLAYFRRLDAGKFQWQTYNSGNTGEIHLQPYGGNVGIGTTGPVDNLHVRTSANQRGIYVDGSSSSGAGDHILLTLKNNAVGGVEWNIDSSGGTAGIGQGKLSFQVGKNEGTAPLVITTAGNVGIGTTAPAAKLDIQGGSDGDGMISMGSNSVSGILNSPANMYINADSDNNSASGVIVFGFNRTGYTGGTEAIRILESGNVGIGTTSPIYKLHVVGSSAISNNNSLFILDTAGSAGFQITNTSSNVALIFQQNNNILKYRAGFSSNSSNAHVFAVGADTEIVRFTNAGNVGIGTTSPVSPLDVNGVISSRGIFIAQNSGTYNVIYNASNSVTLYLGGSGDPANYYDNTYHNFRSGGGGTTYAVINNNGNVGIGTASPAEKLHVAGNIVLGTTVYGYQEAGSKYIGLSYPTLGTNGYVGFQFESVNAPAPYNGNYSQNIKFYTHHYAASTGGTPRMTIQYDGNVGVGTINPAFPLHVARSSGDSIIAVDSGASANAQFRFQEAGLVRAAITYVSSDSSVRFYNSGDRLTILSNGNLGVGVMTPAAKLQVSGSSNVLNVRGSGSAATSSIFSVDGNNGRLFEVSDDLSNSLFSVNTIAGLPVIEAFADYTVTIGTYGAYTLQVTGSRVGVGLSAPGYPLHVSGSVSGISIYATNDIAAFSDQSVKTDLQVIDSAVDRIKQINGYTYVRIDDLSNTRRAGVIAQEVQKVLPEVVSENQDGTLNVAYSNMIALLIEGMKEQQTQIDQLKQRLDNL